ncbi:Oidioi.mRNA.OKI2018_I69.chr2.g6438.t1.cds [Oikopleura dioica]|uniref:ER membrane protein complex subunit 2 n=1 Tax=Oikopleura dioica TaxID=34765 RepID=A0ABN7T9L3_OIKDI|nr:Oidioi.mRNA.OKI2018_I69.chr2.g6438.t1.cds [Oikopleura dioica]
MEGINSSTDAAEMSFGELRKTLRKFRENGTRNATVTYKLGKYMCDNYSSKLGNEVWDVYEQMFFACIDLGINDIGLSYLRQIKEQFPESKRVYRLIGVLHEADGELAEAEELYKEMLEENPGDAAMTKRLISMYKTNGKTVEAVKLLVSYLETYKCDNEAWLELAELYLSEYEYEKAAYCFEELILISPANYLYHQRYAEVRYTIGGAENYLISKMHFCQAARLSGNSSNRALLGLVTVCETLRGLKGVTTEDKESCFKLVKWAKEKLTDKYEKSKVEVSDACPKKNSPKMTDHIDSGLETVCAILDSVKL